MTSSILPKEAFELLSKVRQKRPLVHNITNYVAANFQANVLLALGASPVMAHSEDEVEEMVTLSDALVVNIGTPEKDDLKGMLKVMRKANELGKPVILDPVGVGATQLRNLLVKEILREVRVDVIRGNSSEISQILGFGGKTKGVDSTRESTEILEKALEFSYNINSVIAVTGKVDFVFHKGKVFECGNGTPLFTKITGSGCALSSVIGAFCAVSRDFPKATLYALGVYGVAGELAEEVSKEPGTFMVNFLDKLYSLNQDDLEEGLKIREVR